MLDEEIARAQRSVRTDAYQMSIGEVVSMYAAGDLVVDPEFQRLFRWDISQKSKLIESLLLGIPIPSIFVFEKEDGKWELVDGLQRISTILEFMGALRGGGNAKLPPSIMEATRYLPSLHNVVWERSEEVEGVDVADQRELDRTLQLGIRRARIGVEILKRPSDNNTKFDLFQRLNAGGTQANAQELRNCVMLMVNPQYFRSIRDSANSPSFRGLVNLSDEQVEKQRHLELAVRFLVHSLIGYDGRLDVEEYIDEGAIALAGIGASEDDSSLIDRTFDLLQNAVGNDALRRFENGRHTGKVGLIGLEGIAVGVAKNLQAILALHDPHAFLRDRTNTFWANQEVERFTSPGLRGTTRIQRTVPFGQNWFQP